MITLTAGMIKTFAESPSKYEMVYVRHVEIPSDDTFSEIGKQIHALINYRLKGSNIDKILTVLDEPENSDLKVLWNNFLLLDIEKCEESEFTFNVPLTDEIRLTGRLDALRKTEKGYEILDWKTGSSKNIEPEKNYQTIVYLFSIYELFKYYKKITNYDELKMTYFFLKDNKSVTVAFSEEKYKKYKELLEKICKKICS